MTIQKRYMQLIDFYADGNKSKFAQKIGVAASVIENIVGSRGSNPSFEVMHKTLSAFADINCSWFLLGEGEMNSIQAPGALKKEEFETTREPKLSYNQKTALEMIRDLAAENAILKYQIEQIKEKSD